MSKPLHTGTSDTLALDVGGTFIKSSCIGSDPVDRTKTPPTFLSIVDTVGDIVADNLQPGIRKVGIAATGIMDTGSGGVALSYNLGYRESGLFDFAGKLQKRVGMKIEVHLYNDSDAAAYAEAIVRKKQDLIMITLGTGPGGGIIKGGKIVGAYHHTPGKPPIPGEIASEFGSKIHADLGIKYRNLLSAQSFCDQIGVDGAGLMDLKEGHGDYDRSGLKKYCNDLAHLVRTLSREYGVYEFVIGGGLAQVGGSQSLILEELNSILKSDGIKISRAIYGNNAGLIGAKVLAGSSQTLKQAIEAK